MNIKVECIKHENPKAAKIQAKEMRDSRKGGGIIPFVLPPENDVLICT
jgi:hypothetical protein